MIRACGETMATLKRCEVPFEEMDHAALERRYPQISFERVTRGFLEPKSGVLMARRAVAAVVEDAVKQGVEFRIALIEQPRGSWASRERDVQQWRNDFGGAVCFCLRIVAWQSFSRDSRAENISQPAGSFLFWRAAGRRAVCAAGFADVALSGR